jgi:protein-L-isoaspartate(D-aspartate) O-methyltransferase
MLTTGFESLLLLLAVALAFGNDEAATPANPAGDPYREQRRAMVETQIASRGVKDDCVLDAMRNVPRHRFVPENLHREAHRDSPLPIGRGQTISQPYIVALMTELVRPAPSMKVLEVGTGSGYQAAVLAECVGDVFTIEIVEELGREAAVLLERLGYENVHGRIGDGYDGWPDEAPFDAIVVTAAPPSIPQPLKDQLKIGGRLVIPVGRGSQDLVVVRRTEKGFDKQVVTPVRFVPMTGKAQREP